MESTGFPRAPAEPTGELLSLAQATEKFGVSQWWIYQRVHEGKLHAVHVGKRFKYPDWEVRALLMGFYRVLQVA